MSGTVTVREGKSGKWSGEGCCVVLVQVDGVRQTWVSRRRQKKSASAARHCRVFCQQVLLCLTSSSLVLFLFLLLLLSLTPFTLPHQTFINPSPRSHHTSFHINTNTTHSLTPFQVFFQQNNLKNHYFPSSNKYVWQSCLMDDDVFFCYRDKHVFFTLPPAATTTTFGSLRTKCTLRCSSLSQPHHSLAQPLPRRSLSLCSTRRRLRLSYSSKRNSSRR